MKVSTSHMGQMAQKINSQVQPKVKNSFKNYVNNHPDIAKHAGKVLKNHPEWIDDVVAPKNRHKTKFVFANLAEHQGQAHDLLKAIDSHPNATETLWKHEKKSQALVEAMESHPRLYKKAVEVYQNDPRQLIDYWKNL